MLAAVPSVQDILRYSGGGVKRGRVGLWPARARFSVLGVGWVWGLFAGGAGWPRLTRAVFCVRLWMVFARAVWARVADWRGDFGLFFSFFFAT